MGFYSCNILYWQKKLIDIGLNIPSVINSVDELKFCENIFINKGFHSGPIFPLILYLKRLLGDKNDNLRIIYLLFFGVYLYLSNKILSFENIKKRLLNNLLILFSPVLIWLTIYPSTDLLFSIFFLLALLIFKYYLENISSENEKKETFSKICYLFLPIIFSISIIFSILIRPTILLCFPLLLIWIIYDLYNLITLKNYQLNKKFKFRYFYNIFVLSICTYFLFTFHQYLYSDYGSGNINKFHIYFYSFSPPAPIGLRSAINDSLFKISYLLPVIKENLYQFLSELVKFLILAINHIIYGFISISGLQFKSDINYDSFLSLRNVSALIKSLYGLIIVLPSLYIFILRSFINFKNIILKNKISLIFKKENYFYFSTTLLVLTHLLISIILMPHIRYLVPVLPLIIQYLTAKKMYVMR